MQGTPGEPVPRLFGTTPFRIGSLRLDTEQVGLFVTVLVVAGLLYLLFQKTFLGTSIRAVVDRRELAELAAIDTNRVSQVAWSLGCTLAALTGPDHPAGRARADPDHLLRHRDVLGGRRGQAHERAAGDPLRLPRDGPRAQPARQLPPVRRHRRRGSDTYSAIILNLSSIVLFLALVLFRRLDEVGETGSGPGLALGSLRAPTGRAGPGRRGRAAGGRGGRRAVLARQPATSAWPRPSSPSS